ncbi:ABC-2 family transporter protein-domain-containing protein [Catenaria anguillulae PL171]|uniref:ABC-2 family transporter protein-domain-containing protein n=1 Tax=Catenaria anguillulae PL171 TaxID=765915 RepID=A0A1Y2GH44_9FUNG|nr:ABC-2 family transporter protein-domain-containing protein [Catenaria anguillulae PL171]
MTADSTQQPLTSGGSTRPESIPLPDSPHLIAIDDAQQAAADPAVPTTKSRAPGGDNLAGHLTKEFHLREPEKSTLPVWLNQFLVLTKRNLLLIVRYKKATLAQAVFAPVLFTTLLLLLQTLYVQRQRRERLYPTPATLDGVQLCQGVVESAPCVTVMYTPDTPATRLIMRTFSEKNKERTGKALELTANALTDTSRPQSKIGIVPVPNPDFIYNYVLTNPNTTQFGVAFQSTLPTARYQLWYNTTQAANGSDIYAGELLSMQRGLDEAILAVATTENAVSQPDSFTVAGGLDSGRLDVLVKDWPTVAPENVPDTIVSNMGAMFFFCSVMVVFIAILQDVVTEKELMLRHAMATMGLRASVYWVSTFLSRALLVLLASLVTVVTGIACQFSAFTQSSFLVMLIIFFVFGLAMVSFAFFITTFCRRARVAVLVGMFIFIIGLLFQSFAFSSAFVGYVWWDSSTPTYWQYIFNCIPFFSFGKLFLDVSIMTAGRFDFLVQASLSLTSRFFDARLFI